MGYVRRTSGEIVLDPDEQAQGTIRLVFDLYGRHRTIGRALRHLAANDIRLPVRARSGAAKGELEWHRPKTASWHWSEVISGSLGFHERVGMNHPSGKCRLGMVTCKSGMTNRAGAGV